jgi:hypothetical protein
MEPMVSIELTPQEFGYIMQMLAKRPYEEVAGFIAKLTQQAQANAQIVGQKEVNNGEG